MWPFRCGNYFNLVRILFLRRIKTYLWTFLLVIPGIYKACEYAMVPYILAENPEVSSGTAFRISRQLMDGRKWKLVCLTAVSYTHLKAVNTMDSMVGYKNEKYLYFGRAAARLDDLANLIPARLSALFMIGAAFLLGMNGRQAVKTYRRDRYKHKSPNSAHTEAVCAGALGIRLAGPASYFGKMVEKPYIGDALRPVEDEDIVRCLLYTSGVSAAVHLGARRLGIGTAADAVMVYYLLAARSLRTESMKVYGELKKNDLQGARRAVSMIVGRDTKTLDREGVTKAAVETVAENASDGVIAPLFYTALGLSLIHIWRICFD